jgi:hypothetical protein
MVKNLFLNMEVWKEVKGSNLHICTLSWWVRCQGHEDSQKQRLKERFKFNFQTRNKKKLCDAKIRTQEFRIKTQDVQDQRGKHFFIIFTYANMNMKNPWQGYGVRSCLRIMLNKLKEMRGSTYIYTFLGT